LSISENIHYLLLSADTVGVPVANVKALTWLDRLSRYAILRNEEDKGLRTSSEGFDPERRVGKEARILRVSSTHESRRRLSLRMHISLMGYCVICGEVIVSLGLGTEEFAFFSVLT
jgi:hypothetical protein